MSFITSLEGAVMNNEDMKSIFDQINNLKKPVTESKETNAEYEKDTFREVLQMGYCKSLYSQYR